MGRERDHVEKIQYHANDFPKILMACIRKPTASDLPQHKTQSI